MKKKVKLALSAFFAGKDPDTERRYAYAYNQYLEWGGEGTPRDAAAFIGWMYQEGYADLTIQNTCSALSSIYEYLLAVELVKINPFRAASRVVSWRQKRYVRPTATIDPKLILTTIESIKETKKGIKHKAMLAILFGCGLRRSEMQNLKVDDVQLSRKKTLHLVIKNAKGGKTRKQPIPNWAQEYISAYIVDRMSRGVDANDYLFRSNYGETKKEKPISDRTIARNFRKYFKGAPHSARAAFATQLLDQGYSYQEVAEAVGHSSIEQVKVYDHRERNVDNNVGRLVTY
jgi:integrase/recombinase XerD